MDSDGITSIGAPHSNKLRMESLQINGSEQDLCSKREQTRIN